MAAAFRARLVPPVRLLTCLTFRTFRGALRRPRLVLLATLAVFIYFNILIAKMPAYFTMEDTLDPKLPSVAATKRMEHAFKTGIDLFIAFHSSDGAALQLPELCRLKKWLSEDIYNLPERAPIVTVTSPFTLSKPVSIGDQLVYVPPLVQLACFPDAVTPALGYAATSAELADYLRLTPWREQLATATGGGDLLAQITFRDEDVERGVHFPPGTALAVEQSLTSSFAHLPRVRWQLAGPAAFRAYSQQATAADLYINAGIPLVLTLVFRLFYGSWMAGLLISLAIVVMRSLLLGTMALAGFHTDPLSGSLVTLVSLAAIEDFLFVTRYQLQHQSSWRICYQRFLIPSLLTSLTTMLGFASLTLSDIATVRDLGMWAAYGAFVQWVVIYFFLPCLQAVWPRSRLWARPTRGLFARYSERLVALSLPRGYRRLVLPLLALALLSTPLLRLEDSLDSFFPKSHPASQATAYLRSSRGWDGAFSVVMAHTVTPVQRQKVMAALRQTPAVARVESGSEVIGYLTEDLSSAIAELARRYIHVDDAYRALYSGAGDERLLVYIREANLAQIEQAMATVRSVCPPPACVSAGPLPVFVDFSHAVAASLFSSFGSSLLIVAAFLAGYLWLHDQRHYLAVMASALWGPVVMIAAMALLRLPINFVSCFFAAILVGLSGDNAVQYIYAAKRRPLLAGIEERASGSLEITMCMVTIALLLLFSAFSPPRTLGIVLAIGLLVSLAGDLWILKLLIREDRAPPLSRQPGVVAERSARV